MNFMEKICRRMAAWLGRHNPKLLMYTYAFTSLGGQMNYFTDEFLDKAGNMVDLNYPGKKSDTKKYLI